MKQASLGFRVHSGWTALVAIALDGHTPVVLLRQRPHLVRNFTYEFRQPYHTAENKPLDQARTIISNAEVEARCLAEQVVESSRRGLQKEGYALECCAVLLASGRQLPKLEQILKSHALIHTADGELFRKALIDASESCGMKMFTAKESELLASASRTLHQSHQELIDRLTALGSGLGAPWSQDEKLAALIGWCSLFN